MPKHAKEKPVVIDVDPKKIDANIRRNAFDMFGDRDSKRGMNQQTHAVNKAIGYKKGHVTPGLVPKVRRR